MSHTVSDAELLAYSPCAVTLQKRYRIAHSLGRQILRTSRPVRNPEDLAPILAGRLYQYLAAYRAKRRVGASEDEADSLARKAVRRIVAAVPRYDDQCREQAWPARVYRPALMAARALVSAQPADALGISLAERHQDHLPI